MGRVAPSSASPSPELFPIVTMLARMEVPADVDTPVSLAFLIKVTYRVI